MVKHFNRSGKTKYNQVKPKPEPTVEIPFEQLDLEIQSESFKSSLRSQLEQMSQVLSIQGELQIKPKQLITKLQAIADQNAPETDLTEILTEINKFRDLTLVYFSALSFNKLSIFEFLLSQNSQNSLQILSKLVESRFSAQFFALNFSSKIDEFVTICTQKHENSVKYTKFGCAEGPFYGTIFDENCEVPEVVGGVNAVCAQIIERLANSSEKARFLIGKRVPDLFRALEEFEICEIFSPQRAASVVGTILYLVTDSGLDLKKSELKSTIREFSKKVFFNNKSCFDELVQAPYKQVGSKKPEIADCAIVSRGGEVLLQSEELVALKSCLLCLGLQFVKQVRQ